MEKKYYELPLKFNSLFQRHREFPTCDLKRSIALNIYLIITSKFNEHRFDPDYGCSIWDLDFETHSNPNALRVKIQNSIVQSVRKNELRLYDIRAEVDLTEEEYKFQLKETLAIKKTVHITINGNITETGEPFVFSTKLFLSPLSMD